jgi:hypothetical protein
MLELMSKRPSATVQRWRRLIELQAQSGLSVRAFASERGVNANTLAWWKSRLGAVASTAAFFPVQVIEPPRGEVGVIEIALPNGRLLRVMGDVDVAALRRVLAAVEGAP